MAPGLVSALSDLPGLCEAEGPSSGREERRTEWEPERARRCALVQTHSETDQCATGSTVHASPWHPPSEVDVPEENESCVWDLLF